MSETRTYADRRDYMLVYLREYRARRRREDPEFLKRERAQAKRARTPEAHRAHEAVRRAVAAGRLMRPETCSRCGAGGRIEAAHTDYDRRLDVVWLCQSCHRKWDRVQPKQRCRSW